MDHAALERSSIPSIYSFALTSMSSRLWPPITPAPLGSMAGNKLGLPDVMPAVHLPLLSGFRQNMKKPRYRPVRCPFKNLGLILLAIDNAWPRSSATQATQVTKW
jgi:hypothetical protein